jgi:SRSO17 transposase
MKRRQPDFSRQSERLQSYLDSLTRTVGHADRVVPLENYTKGLLLPLERKSVEPMAARVWLRATCARCTSRCITLWPTRPGAMPRC